MLEKILRVKNMSNLKVLVTAAFFSTISFVCGKFLAFNVGDTLRFSFENLPIILSGMLFGPMVGAVTGLAADIIGCILRGYTINPIVTFAAAFIGFSSGLVFDLSKKIRINLGIIITVLFCHITGSVIIKTVGLCFLPPYYPFAITLFQRIINYIVMAVLEIVVLEILFKNKYFYKQITRMTGVKNEL